jgi:hypothetical protein
MAKVDLDCACECGCAPSAECISTKRALLAGAFGGIVAASVAIVVAATFAAAIARAALLSRRVALPVIGRLMERLMRGGDVPPVMQACMEKCGCAPKAKGENGPQPAPADSADSAGAAELAG